ncbi:hypothetical protein [Sulfurimonas sp.]|uniref:hypothetical protein n=1 Tax=Sulfurimonas sp. TaxID=2022749 RepID=UPI002B48550C|nr:hypothetical protein [Sulfurimonas sp.]
MDRGLTLTFSVVGMMMYLVFYIVVLFSGGDNIFPLLGWLGADNFRFSDVVFEPLLWGIIGNVVGSVFWLCWLFVDTLRAEH